MTFFDTFQFITLIAFLGTLVIRAVTIAARQGIVPVVFGNEKTLGRRILNFMLFPAMLYWLYEIINTSPSIWASAFCRASCTSSFSLISRP
ncbi:MAG: hypothetical protein A2014_02675 [Spirochaetes bacterium GWF1_49_6]|nr:MAG: hypothetical protein A2014_02675 [Spirochaetes bacterium GWF1_49_6]